MTASAADVVELPSHLETRNIMGLEQFRACYPMGGVITELVLYKQGQYVVRCCLEVDGRAIATGLSAAPTVEAAEDQARDRAIALWLKIPSPALTAAPASPAPPPTQDPKPTPPPPVVQPAPPKAAETPTPVFTPDP
ncbi:hypothetical protein PN477_19235, partial [Spirulina subsalsa CS-330]|nr:hypothetical protein [Spirulina subsalsa CS-330]